MAEMTEARVKLLRHQLALFGKVQEAATRITSERIASLLPEGYVPERITAPVRGRARDKPQEEESQESKPKKRVSFADGTHDKPEEASSAKAPSPPAEDVTEPAESLDASPDGAPPRDAAEGASAEDDDAQGDPLDAAPMCEPRTILAPIDITASLRTSLSSLHTTLEGLSDKQKPHVQDAGTDTDDDGLMDLHPADATERKSFDVSKEYKRLEDTIASMRANISSRILNGDSRFTAYTGSVDRSKNSGSSEVMQIKAEIRSLKGLMLSRRNFPSYRGAPRATATTPETAAPPENST